MLLVPRSRAAGLRRQRHGTRIAPTSPSAAALCTVGRHPTIDLAIISTMRQGAGNAVPGVVLLSLPALSPGAGFPVKARFSCCSPPSSAALLIGLGISANRHPACFACAAELSRFKRGCSREDYRRIMGSDGSPPHLRSMAWEVPVRATHRMIQGHECHHCRKRAIRA